MSPLLRHPLRLLRLLRLLLLVALFSFLAEGLVRTQMYGAAGLSAWHMSTVHRVLMSEFALEPRQRDLATIGADGLLPNTKGWSRGVPFEVNNFGFRGKDTTRLREPGTFRIAVVGSSVTMASGIPMAHTWPVVLEDLLNRDRPEERRPQGPESRPPRVEILNLAVPNTRSCLEQHLDRATYFQPDVILWQVSHNATKHQARVNLARAGRFAAARNLPILVLWLNQPLVLSRGPGTEFLKFLPPLGVTYGPEHYLYPSDDHPDAFIHGVYANKIAARLAPRLEALRRLVPSPRPGFRSTWKPPRPVPWNDPEEGFWTSYAWDRLCMRSARAWRSIP